MRFCRYACLAVMLLLPAYANATLRGMQSLEWKALHAEEIVTGTVNRVDPAPEPDCAMCSMFTVSVGNVLKGVKETPMHVLLKNYPIDYPSEWARAQHIMLFFLAREGNHWRVDNGADSVVDLERLSNNFVVNKNGEGLYDSESILRVVKDTVAVAPAGTPKSKTVTMNLSLVDHGKQVLLPKGNQASVVVPAE